MTQRLSDFIATEVRAEMARQKLSGRWLATKLGLSQPQMADRLNGQIEIRPNELQLIAQILGVPITNFVRDDDARGAA